MLLPDEGVTGGNLTAVRERFETNYEREYTYRLDTAVEVVGLHLVGQAEVGKLALVEKPVQGRDLADAEKGRRMVDFDLEGRHEATLYDGAMLEPGMRFDGPAIIEEAGATIVVRPGDDAAIDRFGNVILHVRQG